MFWNVYRLVYRAMSPIHLGWHTLGYIKLTRHYIPGKNIWGAMTANLTRTYGAEGVKDYERLGKLLKEDILTSYFYPAIDQNNLLLPYYKDDGLLYGDPSHIQYISEDFEKSFVGSFGQTAIWPYSNTAEDESLHESEYISPIINNGEKSEQVFFVGYLFIKKGASFNGSNIGLAEGDISLESAIQDLFVGGDIKYGWGRLKLQNSPADEGCQEKMFGYEFVSNGKLPPCIKIPKGFPIPAHLKVESELKVKGDIEPLVGRQWGTVRDSDGKEISGAGQEISSIGVCWTPGSVMEEEETQTLRIGKYGILTKGD